MKLADQPGHGLPHHVDPLKVDCLLSQDQVKDVEVSVKKHRGGGVPFQCSHQCRLFTRSQNLMFVKILKTDFLEYFHLLPVDSRVSISEMVFHRHLPDKGKYIFGQMSDNLGNLMMESIVSEAHLGTLL